MAVKITGQANLHGLQHAEQLTILAYFKDNFAKGTIAILKFGKTTAAAAAASGVSGAAITVYYNGPGAAAKGGTEIFAVPSPDVGTGLTFTVATAIAIGTYALYRNLRSSAILT